MIDRFRRSVFGWDVRPADASATAPSPKKTHVEELLALANLRSFQQGEANAEVRQAHGLMPGWHDEVHDAEGVVVDYRRRRYASMTEAGLDHAIEQISDPVALARARYLQPLGRRYVLLRERAALAAVPLSESRPRPRERATPAPVGTVAADWTPVGNSVAMYARRQRIESERRDFQSRNSTCAKPPASVRMRLIPTTRSLIASASTSNSRRGTRSFPNLPRQLRWSAHENVSDSLALARARGGATFCWIVR